MMSWNYMLCEGDELCPGRVMLTLTQGHSELAIYTEEDGALRTFPCSVGALLGVQRGSRSHLASDFGECVLSKEADGVWVAVYPREDGPMRFFIPPDEYLIGLTKFVEARALQSRVSVK